MSLRGQRVVLVVLLVAGAVPGMWALVAPASFYGSFPGAGLRWVAADGPYNRHLVADVGAMYLALVAVTAGALVSRAPAVTTVAAAAWLVFSVPHWAYHSAHLDLYGPRDQVLNEVALGGVVLLAALLCVPRGRWTGAPADRAPAEPAPARSIGAGSTGAGSTGAGSTAAGAAEVGR